MTQLTLALNLEENNPQAMEDFRNYIDLCKLKHHAMVLYDVIMKRYGVRPYGWPDMEVLILVVRLLAVGEISLRMEGGTLPLDKVYENIKTPARWRKITIHKRKTSDPKALQQARRLGKDVFAEMGPDNEDDLCAFLKEKLRSWENALSGFKPLADTGDYPGREELAESLSVIKPLLANDESYKFIEKFNQSKNDLLDLSDEFHNLEQFYETQRPTWEKLRAAYQKFQLNRLELEQDEEAAPSLRRMGEILEAPAPYAMLYEGEGLIRSVSEVNEAMITQRRSDALVRIDGHISEMTKELETVKGKDTLRYTCLGPLERLQQGVDRIESVAHIIQSEQEAVRSFDEGLAAIEEFVLRTATPTSEIGDPPVKPRCIVNPAELATKKYLETTDDIEKFLSELRERLEKAVKAGQRIKIR